MGEKGLRNLAVVQTKGPFVALARLGADHVALASEFDAAEACARGGSLEARPPVDLRGRRGRRTYGFAQPGATFSADGTDAEARRADQVNCLARHATSRSATSRSPSQTTRIRWTCPRPSSGCIFREVR